jgi:hypothetical protein
MFLLSRNLHIYDLGDIILGGITTYKLHIPSYMYIHTD